MKLFTVVLLVAAVVLVECGPTFMGTSVLRPLVYHKQVRYPSKMSRKRTEYFTYKLPTVHRYSSIQGILAYDLTNSGASANVTRGGLHNNFVKLRMESGRNKNLHFDVYIYA